jgi:hypothetical protein
MCVYKNHAFICFGRPPSWSGTVSSEYKIWQSSVDKSYKIIQLQLFNAKKHWEKIPTCFFRVYKCRANFSAESWLTGVFGTSTTPIWSTSCWWILRKVSTPQWWIYTRIFHDYWQLDEYLTRFRIISRHWKIEKILVTKNLVTLSLIYSKTLSV